MVKLLIGNKGTGKTKRLIDICNNAAAESKGNVVFIEKEGILIHDVDRKARLVVVDEYNVEGFEQFYGFISGMCASDYDLTDIVVDSTLKICGKDFGELETFVNKLDDLTKTANANIVLSISADLSEIPESMKSKVEQHK